MQKYILHGSYIFENIGQYSKEAIQMSLFSLAKMILPNEDQGFFCPLQIESALKCLVGSVYTTLENVDTAVSKDVVTFKKWPATLWLEYFE